MRLDRGSRPRRDVPQAGMRDLNDLGFFAAVVKHESFSAAARALGVPKSRISRRIAALEEQLGLRLLERTTRRLSVTEVGRDVYRQARAVMDEAAAIDEVALRMKSTPQVLVRISCPLGVQRGLTGSLPAFLDKHPLLRLQFLMTNRPVNLIEEGVDIAIRIRERLDTDGELQMRRIGISRRILVASRALLREFGTPQHPEDLQRFPIIHSTERLGPITWELAGPEGKLASVPVDPKVSAGDFAILFDATVAGIGLALLPEIDCWDAIDRTQLVRVLPKWSVAEGIIHLVFPSRRGMLPSVRATIDFLATTLKSTIGSK
jgi:DNA-binding transcriptional LysR family regulator